MTYPACCGGVVEERLLRLAPPNASFARVCTSSHTSQECYPPPPLQTPGLARDGRQVTVSQGGGGGLQGYFKANCGTDASKENTREATFALVRCQCVSVNTNVIEDPKEW